jgi:hypothetical protein
MLGTQARGASNVKAESEFGWTLRYPSWRQGFVEAYANGKAMTEPTAESAARRAA